MRINHGVPQIPGERPPEDVKFALREIIAGAMGRQNLSFPGAQPVSFARGHIKELMNQDYFMCEKTDGMRCLLWLDGDSNGNEACYMIDRKNDYYYLQNAHFPRAHDPTFMGFHNQTLLDGELVFDTIKGPNGQPETRLRFLVFDLMVLERENVMSKSLGGRLGRLRESIMKPYEQWLTAHPYALASQPFELTAKAMELPYAIGVMFKEKLPNLAHGNDGLVFTCINTPYKCGTDENILKWKPPHENTIDFRLELESFPMFDPEDGEVGPIPDYNAIPAMSLQMGLDNNTTQHYAYLHVEPEEWESMKSMNEILDGRIIECYKDDRKRWRFKPEPNGFPRFRDDKSAPNHRSTVVKVEQSIEDGVTAEELMAAEQQIRHAWKAREARKKQEEMARRQQHVRKHSIESQENGVKRLKTEDAG